MRVILQTYVIIHNIEVAVCRDFYASEDAGRLHRMCLIAVEIRCKSAQLMLWIVHPLAKSLHQATIANDGMIHSKYERLFRALLGPHGK